MLHQYDPQTDEEMKELQDYLHKLSTTVSIPVVEEESDNEDIDMSLWDLLYRVSNKNNHTILCLFRILLRTATDKRGLFLQINLRTIHISGTDCLQKEKHQCN